MPRYELRGKRVWVTGASSGIGAALTRALVDAGAQVVMSARGREALDRQAEQLGRKRAFAVPLDVTDREANHQAVEQIRWLLGGLDLVILNAGTCEYVDVEHFDAALFERQVQVNLLGMVYGIEAALTLLRESDAPYLVGVSSMSAYSGLSRAEAYGATKAAIRNMLQSLRVDLRPENIDVSVVFPGFVETPLTERNDFPMPFKISAEQAAAAILRGLSRRRPEIQFPRHFGWLVKLYGALPGSWHTRLGQYTLKRKPS